MFPELTRDDVFRLETRRLWLRWPRMADAAAILRLAGEKAVAEMTASIPHPYPSQAVEPFIFAMRKGNALGEHLVLAITPRSKPNELIGMIGAHKQASGTPFIGYWLGTPHWGKGYATEAVQGLIDTLFSLVDVPAIDADTRVINPASRRVLEKSGFRAEGSFLKSLPARGGLFPCEQFRLDRSTWAALKSWSASGWAHAPELEAEEEPARAPALDMPLRRQQEQAEPCPA
ncbi:50S ribosomal protein acetyltransferase [Hyphomicrobiales bacterium]|nr:50S ribosomal protein acetyltransferase [Hyphomicrobiales bacterium]CAH1699088.1 50S ribosomal protein acetyltransferase [Hyphomicrobiales bacterium]CAI0342877.1 (ribosomal protein S5)-alanine N-acetyltransferase [Hyphomicrobiales bacterium]